MSKTKLIILALAAPLLLTGCQGMHRSGKLTTAHAEAIQILGLQIPGSPQERLDEMVPKNAEVVTAVTSPDDFSSVLGFLGRVWGIGYSTASWKNQD